MGQRMWARFIRVAGIRVCSMSHVSGAGRCHDAGPALVAPCEKTGRNQSVL